MRLLPLLLNLIYVINAKSDWDAPSRQPRLSLLEIEANGGNEETLRQVAKRNIEVAAILAQRRERRQRLEMAARMGSRTAADELIAITGAKLCEKKKKTVEAGKCPFGHG